MRTVPSSEAVNSRRPSPIELDAVDRAVVPRQVERDRLACRHVPDPRAAVSRCDRDPLPAGSKVAQLIGRPSERTPTRAGDWAIDIPKRSRCVAAASASSRS